MKARFITESINNSDFRIPSLSLSMLEFQIIVTN